MEEKIIQNQIALFNLLSALAQKVTGQTPSVNIEQEDGSMIKITPSSSSVTWMEAE